MISVGAPEDQPKPGQAADFVAVHGNADRKKISRWI
jgi:hypothetical protein